VYDGEIQLRNLAQPLRWEDPQSSLSFEKLPGQVRVTRGELTGNNIVGPVHVTARSSDVQLSDFTQSLDLTLNRGDIDLKPGKNLPKMQVHTRSGDITLALVPGSKFDLRASTDRGEGDNEYGEPLRQQESGRGNTIEGNTGGGPELRLETGRGSITVRKASAEDSSAPDIPIAPKAPTPPKSPNPPLKVEHQ